MSLTIGEVARRANVAPTTVRYYEKVDLLPAPARIGGQRRYDESILDRLEVIRMCKVAGFTLDETRTLFADGTPGRTASQELAEAKLAEIDARISTLRAARQLIEWGMSCTRPSIGDCTCGVHRLRPDLSPTTCHRVESE